jgi:hypothetical protein
VLIFIPTLDTTLAIKCARSLDARLAGTSVAIVIVYNGSQPCESQRLSDRIFIIGSDALDGVVRELSHKCKGDLELLFGSREYGRSYGGSSNLISVLAAYLGSSIFLKIDDDFIVSDSDILALPYPPGARTIYFGKESFGDSGLINMLPAELSSELSQFVYTEDQYKERTGNTFYGSTKKNGIVYGSSQTLKCAHYPVLYSHELKIHARGEIYWFLRQLEKAGGSMLYCPGMNLTHNPPLPRSVENWLRATVLGTVFWWRFRDETSIGKYDYERRFRELRSWLLGRNASGRRLLDDNDAVLNFDSARDFADRIFDTSPQRARFWFEITSIDVQSILKGEIPFFNDIRLLMFGR